MPSGARVLVVEADEALRRQISGALESDGCRPQVAKNRVQANALLRSLQFDAVVCAVQLPDGDGEQIFRDARPFLGATPVIFTAAQGNVDQAVRLIKAGAADYLKKPGDVRALAARVRQAMNLREARAEERTWPDPVMESPVMLELKKRVERLAASTVSALIVGEAGTGKEVVARYIHRLSARADAPFVTLRCGSLAGQDGEKLLFGEAWHVAPNRSKLMRGALEEAHGGTLMLEEIGELPAGLHGALIQAIERRRFRRVGDTATELPLTARLLATSRFPVARLRERMTPDLVDRLAIIELAVPPLRQRPADIEPLVHAMLPAIAAELGRPLPVIEPEAVAAMRVHDWPGNIRELRNRLVRALTFAAGGGIGIADIFPGEVADDIKLSEKLTLNGARVEAERERIVEALTLSQGRIGRAAESLGISRVTLWTKMKRLGISPASVRPASEPVCG